MNLKDTTAITLYLILTLLFTYPLAFNINNKVPGIYDVWSHVWNLWWVNKSLLSGQNPYYTDYVFHPTGTGLELHTLSLFNSITGILLQQFFSLITTYNLLVLFSFVASAYGTYLLVHYLTKDRRVAFFSGVVFAFSPYRFLEIGAGHLNLVSTEWIPFYALYLIKTLEEGGRKNTLLASLFLLLVSLCSWQYMGFMLIFTVFYVLYTSWFNGVSIKKLSNKVIPILFVFSIMVLPFIYPIALGSVGGFGVGSGLEVTVFYSADALSFIGPNALHPLLGGLSATLSNKLKSNGAHGGILALGYITLLLAFYQISTEVGSGRIEKIKRSLKSRGTLTGIIAALFLFALVYLFFRVHFLYYVLGLCIIFLLLFIYSLLKEKRIGVWGASFFFFLLLSLGPFLNVLGRPVSLTPYILLYILPGFSIFRAPARFVVLAMLSLAILSGFGLKKILKKTNRKNLLTAIAISVVLFEFLSIPVQLSPTSIPSIYDRISGSEGEYAILEVPISPIRVRFNGSLWETGLPQYMYYQTVHGKKIVGGYVSYPSDYARAFLGNSTLFHRLNNPYENASDEKIAGTVRETLDRYDIRYVILHKDVLNSMFPGTLSPINGLFNETLSLTYEDDMVIVYNV